MGDDRMGKATYIRTPQQNARMSAIVSAKDQTANIERFRRINAEKRGKTFQQLYPEKADILIANMKRRFTGEGNPNWLGGKRRNKYPYAFHRLRSEIIGRDGLRCQNCNMTDEEHRQRFAKHSGLTVHHIDYDKDNNVPSNLITLCVWCNSSANHERKKWQKLYLSKLAG